MVQFENKVFRLKGRNYSSPGTYFVTICTAGKSRYLGDLQGDIVHLNRLGETAYQYWQKIPEHFPFVSLGEFAIMPDHVHGILVFDYDKNNKVKQSKSCGDTRFCVPIRLFGVEKFGPQSKNLGSVIRGFKAAVKKFAVMNNLPLTWQSRFRDQLIRDLSLFRMHQIT